MTNLPITRPYRRLPQVILLSLVVPVAMGANPFGRASSDPPRRPFGQAATRNAPRSVSIPKITNLKDADWGAGYFPTWEDAALALQKSAAAGPDGRVTAVICRSNDDESMPYFTTPLRFDRQLERAIYPGSDGNQPEGLLVSEALKKKGVPVAYYVYDPSGSSSDLAPVGENRSGHSGPTVGEMLQAAQYRDEHHPSGLPLIKDTGGGSMVMATPRLDSSGNPDFTFDRIDSNGHLEEMDISDLRLSRAELEHSRKVLKEGRYNDADSKLPGAPVYHVDRTLPDPGDPGPLPPVDFSALESILRQILAQERNILPRARTLLASADAGSIPQTLIEQYNAAKNDLVIMLRKFSEEMQETYRQIDSLPLSDEEKARLLDRSVPEEANRRIQEVIAEIKPVANEILAIEGELKSRHSDKIKFLSLSLDTLP